jgi:hypothetical protein
MDVAVDHDCKRMPAMTVRQFAPSRLEKQLLIQVFELAFNPQRQTNPLESARAETTRTLKSRSEGEESYSRRRAA